MSYRDRPLKITVVGDSKVGKSCLLFTYTKKVFPSEYVPSVLDDVSFDIEVEKVSYNVSFWDTLGHKVYERLRVFTYPNTDVFLLCYSVDSRKSFINVSTKWVLELRHHCPTAPIVLVGTKVDIRKDGSSDANFVSYAEGLKISENLGKFVECSALTGENLEALFEEAVRVALNKPKKRKHQCCKLI